MAKSKVKQPQNKNSTLSDPDFEECVQEGWIIVRKQKVTIFIPPLPITQQPPMPSPRGSPLKPISTQEIDRITSPQPDPPVTTPLVANPPNSNHRATLVNSHNKDPKFRRRIGICSALKQRKYCGSLVNTKMRAVNLERKIKKAGGLDSWLVSLGLGQFVKIFRCKRVGKVQLVNLTMKKLKDMGVVAVGPRRKLIHAIDCLW